jgi:hypothetical protein
VPLYYTNAHRQDYRTVARWLEQHYEAGDGLVCSEDGAVLAMDYYLQAYPGPAHFPADSQCAFGWLPPPGQARPVTAQTLAAYGTAHARIFYVSTTVAADTAGIKMQVRTTRQWLDQHYRLVSQVFASAYYGPVIGRLYATKAAHSTPSNR